MVEAGQRITDTRTREFGEEALAMMDASDEAGRKVGGTKRVCLGLKIMRE